jgi:hypothetical protein
MRNIVGGRQRTVSQGSSRSRTRKGRPAFRPVPEWLEARVVLSLTIQPIWDSSIMNDPNAKQIESTIQTAINIFGSYIATPITVPITFAEQSSIPLSPDADPANVSLSGVSVSYASYLAALNSRAFSTDDKTAVAVLNAAGPNIPVPGESLNTIELTPVLAEAMGLVPTLASTGSGADARVQVSSGGTITSVETTVPPDGAGSGYPKNSTFDLFVHQPGSPLLGSYTGSGGIVQAMSNSAGEVTGYNPIPVAGGSGYNSLLNLLFTVSSAATIYLTEAELNPARPDASQNKYDLQATVMHGMDEVLGLGIAGSVLGGANTNPPKVGAPGHGAGPLDLFRFEPPTSVGGKNVAGARSFDTGLQTQAEFSIDGGYSDIVGFNQVGGADYGDFNSVGSNGTLGVQDAIPIFQEGLMLNLSAAELTALDVIGWTINMDLPDLSLKMGDSVGGATTSGQNWTWTLDVTNEGSEPAVFSDGQAILADNLPISGLTYNSVTVPAASQIGVTGGTISVPANVPTNGNLIATAKGPVTIASGGSFEILINATATAPNVFENPREYITGTADALANVGVAMADPYGLIAETTYTNNTADDTVTVLPGVSITTAPIIGDNNKASVTVSGTCDNGDSVTLTVTGTNGGNVSKTATVTGNTWSVSFNGSGLADGPIIYSATETPVSGPPLTASRGASKLTAASPGGALPPAFYWQLETTPPATAPAPVVDPNNLTAGYNFSGDDGTGGTITSHLDLSPSSVDYSYSDSGSQFSANDSSSTAAAISWRFW